MGPPTWRYCRVLWTWSDTSSAVSYCSGHPNPGMFPCFPCHILMLVAVARVEGAPWSQTLQGSGYSHPSGENGVQALPFRHSCLPGALAVSAFPFHSLFPFSWNTVSTAPADPIYSVPGQSLAFQSLLVFVFLFFHLMKWGLQCWKQIKVSFMQLSLNSGIFVSGGW